MNDKEIIKYVLNELDYLESVYYSDAFNSGDDDCGCGAYSNIAESLEELIKDIKNYEKTTRSKNNNFEDLKTNVLSWADDKDLLHSENADKQFMKFIEEVFEFKSAFEIVKLLNINEHSFFDMMLEMGDIFVTLIILCKQIGMDPEDCLSMAYEKISKRKGKTINGQFIKEEDL